MAITAVLLTILGLTSPNFPQDVNQRISIEEPGKPTHAVFRTLTEKTGIKLAVGKDLGSEPLVLSIKNSPMKDVMKHIAIALHADWKQDGDVHRLVARPGLPSEFFQVLEACRAYQATIKKQLAEMPPLDDESAKLLMHEVEGYIEAAKTQQVGDHFQAGERLAKKGPGNRLAMRVFAAVPIESLVSKPPLRRTVYSTSPTSKQVRLPVDLGDAVKEFERELAAWKKVADNRSFSLPQERPIPRGISELLGSRVYGDSQQSEQEKIDPVQMVWVELTGSGSFIVKVIGKSGNYLSDTFFNIPPTPGKGSNPSAQLPAKQTDWIDVSDQARRYIAIVNTGASKTPPEKGSSLRSALLSPDITEPVSVAFGETLLRALKGQERSLIACPPDYPMHLFGLEQGKFSLTKSLAAWKTNALFALEEVDDYIIIRKVHRQFITRADRKELANLLRSCETNGTANLESLAAYAVTLPDDAKDLGMLARNTMYGLNFLEPGTYHNLSSLRFYGSLSPQQRALAAQGKSFKFSDLTSQQRHILEVALYENHLRLEFDTGTSGKDPSYLYRTVISEPTFKFGNNFPSDAVITIEDNASTALLTSITGQNGEYKARLSPKELGHQIYVSQFPPPGYPAMTVNDITATELRTVRIQIKLDAETFAMMDLSENKNLTSALTDFRQLPKHIVEQVEKGYNEAKEMRAKRPPY